jgi:circadian clock protein KaiC
MFRDDSFARISSGIPGLDEMIEGGFPCPSMILLAGAAGTGKSTFCLQFLTKGAELGERGLFFTTLSEPTQWMLRFTSRYKFVNRDFFGKEIKFVELGPVIQENPDCTSILDFIEENIVEVMPSRIVIDPVTIIKDLALGNKYRCFLYKLSTHLKNWQATTIVTGEVLPKEPYPVEISYIADGVLLLNYGVTNDGRTQKFFEVLKMRGTQHSTGKNLVNISRDGMQINPGLR